MEAVEVTLKELARTADVIVEARVSEPSREMRQEFTDDGCGGFAVQVYRLDVLTVRVDAGNKVPSHVDAYDPKGWREGMARHAECQKQLPDPTPPTQYETPVVWGPGREVVVLLEWDGERWMLAAHDAWDDVNRADKVARWAGIKQ